MSYSGGIVGKPVRTIDIAQALGVASRDEGTLCTSDKINMWAKRKPIKMNTLSPVSDEDRRIHYFGIKLNPQTGFWEKDLPHGIAYNEPFRMRDFDGYNVNAVAPMYDFYEVPNPINTDTQTLRISPDEFFRKEGGNVELSLDLFPFIYSRSYYIGLLAKDVTTGRMIYSTGEDTLENFFQDLPTQIVYVSLENLSANSGDEIEIWVCCARESNVRGGVCTPAMLDAGIVQKIALSENIGHTRTVASNFAVSDIYFLGTMSGFWDMFRPSLSSPLYYRSHLSGASVDLFADYLFSNTETLKIYVELFVNSVPVSHTVKTLGAASVGSDGMFTVSFNCDYDIEFAQGDTDFPVNFDIAIRRADADGNPVGARQYMWHTYTFDAGLQRATYVAGLQGRDPRSMDELYFVETGEKIVSQNIMAQLPYIHIDDKGKGRKRRTYTLDSPEGYRIYFSVDGNRLKIDGLDNLDEGEVYNFTLNGHIGPTNYPRSSRNLKIVYLP